MNINEDNPRTKICEEYKDSLIKVNDYAFIDIWNKVFKIKNLSFFFQQKQKISKTLSNLEKNYVDKFEEMVQKQTDMRLSRTLYIKILQPVSESTMLQQDSKVFHHIRRYVFIKLIWKNYQIINIKFGYLCNDSNFIKKFTK